MFHIPVCSSVHPCLAVARSLATLHNATSSIPSCSQILAVRLHATPPILRTSHKPAHPVGRLIRLVDKMGMFTSRHRC